LVFGKKLMSDNFQDNVPPHELFLQWCVDEMAETGETEDVILATEEMKGRAVHGYEFKRKS
jgi:hypothetical protein